MNKEIKKGLEENKLIKKLASEMWEGIEYESRVNVARQALEFFKSQGYHQVEEVQIPELREKIEEILYPLDVDPRLSHIPKDDYVNTIISIIQPLIDQAVQAERAKYEEVGAKVLRDEDSNMLIAWIGRIRASLADDNRSNALVGDGLEQVQRWLAQLSALTDNGKIYRRKNK